MSTTFEESEAAILERIFDPAAGWSTTASKAMLEVAFSPKDLKRMTELLEKANAGDLEDEEVAILERYPAHREVVGTHEGQGAQIPKTCQGQIDDAAA